VLATRRRRSQARENQEPTEWDQEKRNCLDDVGGKQGVAGVAEKGRVESEIVDPESAENRGDTGIWREATSIAIVRRRGSRMQDLEGTHRQKPGCGI
jgi:hypothetical protein